MTAATAYDEVAYPSHPFRQTHPQLLGVAAVLLGAPHTPMAGARVLEIGCGEGGNIIPLAASYPDARIVGFDLAASAIAAGQAIVDELGLGNIELKVLDILDAGPELGEFDYIIAHGVYSWVPEPVRAALLKLVGERLAPSGLAFVSYNALPGCHLRLLMREMLMHHLRGVEGFEARVAAARELLQLLAAGAQEGVPATQAIKAQCRSMLERDPRVLFHDELGPIYAPFFLHQFVADASRHGLQYVADAESLWWREELFPSPRGLAVEKIAGRDPVQFQQYLDFLSARFFRQTLLARADLALDRQVDHRRIRLLWATADARPESPDPDLTSPAALRFKLGSDATISLDNPALKQALFRLGQGYPQAVLVAELPDDPDVNEGLLQLFTAGHVELSTGPAPMTLHPGERPAASPLARLQAASSSGALTGLDHRVIQLQDDQARAFLARLDGQRTRETLAAEMSAGGEPVSVEQVDAHIAGLARLALMIG